MDRELRPNNIRNGLSLFMGNLSRGCCENIHRDTGAITLRDNLVLRHCYTLNGNGPSFRSNVATIRHKLPPPIYMYTERKFHSISTPIVRSVAFRAIVYTHVLCCRSILRTAYYPDIVSYCAALTCVDTRTRSSRYRRVT